MKPENRSNGTRLVIRPDGRVTRIGSGTLEQYLPEGVLKRVTTHTGAVIVPESGTGKHSVPRALRRVSASS